MDVESLKRKWAEAGQEQVFRFWDELNEDQRQSLYKQALSIDVTLVNQVYEKLSKEGHFERTSSVKPLPDVVTQDKISDEDRNRWKKIGYEEIAKGHVAVLLMAGGQGTRLGCNDPKGMYDVGLLSHKSLFQIQAERIWLLQKLAAQKAAKPIESVAIPWYIMTSFVTEAPTKAFFERNNYFGLNKENIFFFNQDLFPCVTENGKILLQSKSEIAIAPNGNGGLWAAIYKSGALDDMERRSIKIVASYGVDNILAKVADPLFVGFCCEKKSPICCKVVSKAYPEERVGVLCLKDNKPAVIEYSEIDPEQASARDPLTNNLLYNAAHIVLNNFTVDFIKDVAHPEKAKLLDLPYHVAKKQIPCIDTEGNPTEIMGWKFEMFVFDVFEFANSLSAMEVVRSEEFSPLKNSISSPSDNPITCRQHLSQLHQKYLIAAGGKIISRPNTNQNTVQNQNPSNNNTTTIPSALVGGEEPLFEISSKLSYDGEGLEQYVKGKEYTLPFYLE